jgi:hypothetical protein
MIAEAKILFKGKGFHSLEWENLLRDAGFRATSGGPDKSIYASGGSYIIVENKRFIKLGDSTAYGFLIELRQTRAWHGYIKFYATLLAAFDHPQEIIVTVDELDFTEQNSLRQHAEKKVLQLFSQEELIDNRVYREGDGIQFL